MQCGHDSCRHWWWGKGKYSWCSVLWDRPVICVLSLPETKENWGSYLKPPNFIPLQDAVTELRKLRPAKKMVTENHVVNVYGTGFTPAKMAAKIAEINAEALLVVRWGRLEVKKRMVIAMTRVGLKVGDRMARKFEDIKSSLRDNASEENIARIYEICYGDYEGKENKKWSGDLEVKYMRENLLRYGCDPKNGRNKGGIELCITKAKGDMVAKVWDKTTLVLSLKNTKSLPVKWEEQKRLVKEKKEKPARREIGEFYVKKKVCGRLTGIVPYLTSGFKKLCISLSIDLYREREYGSYCTKGWERSLSI
jgi:hypothetical protein